MPLAWVGLGSNLGDSAATLETAIKQIHGLPQSRCLRRSALYRSAPVGPQDQPDFCNAVVEVATGLPAPDFLNRLLEIEQNQGRRRTRHWGPRSLDLDLLLYDVLVVNTPELQLPHPRMHERAFVLAPLAELAPALNLPGHGNVAELLKGLSNQRISRWQTP